MSTTSLSTTDIAFIFAGVVLVILILRWKSKSSSSEMLSSMSPTQPVVAAQPETGEAQRIAQLLGQGKKIEAIKAYSEFTGVSLEEAKNALEKYGRLMDRVTATTGFSEWTQIDALIRAGNKIEAIKLYRQMSGADLKESKEAIDERESEIS
jgi:ribosomal protein L7/L12